MTATGRISAFRARLLTARRTLVAGRSVTVRLRLTRRVRRAVGRALRHTGRRIVAAVSVTARDAGGNVTRRTVTVRVVR